MHNRGVERLPARVAEFAAEVSRAAADLALTPDVSRIQSVDIYVAQHSATDTRPFWTAALGYDPLGDTDAFDPLRRGPQLAFNPIRGDPQGRGRTHIDVSVPADQAPARVAAVLAAGGRLVDDSQAPAWWTVASPDGHGIDIASLDDTRSSSQTGVLGPSWLVGVPFPSDETDARTGDRHGPQTLRILGIAGSLRRASFNRGLIRAAVEVAPPGITVTTHELHDLPMFDADMEAIGDPAPVAALKRAVADADALLIATPEYNHCVPGVLKNALDWASRPPRASVAEWQAGRRHGRQPRTSWHGPRPGAAP